MSAATPPGASTGTQAGIGVAIECASERVEMLVQGADGAERARVSEDVAHGHTRRVTSVLGAALDRAGVAPLELEWVAVDLGPGSFTGVRVGLATAHALSAAGGARVVGASSLASLALGAPLQRGLIVPLVPAGRTEVYAAFFRGDGRATARQVGAARVLGLAPLLEAIEEMRRATAMGVVRCVGPGAARWREGLESAYPRSTSEGWRYEGLSAADLAAAALSGHGPASGLPPAGAESRPLYVRSAQAEERVRHMVNARAPLSRRPMEPGDIPAVAAVERAVFGDPWPESFFLGELNQPLAYARVAERDGRLVGYCVAWLSAGAPAGGGSGHLGNLAVAPDARRGGVASTLLCDLLVAARERGVTSLTLEVRASNDAAQGLYRGHGFRLAGLRRGYYRDTGEDALVMEWRDEGGSGVLAQA